MALQLQEEAVVTRHLFTLDEYDRLCEAGVFDEDARIELIRGEIVDMPPPGPEHESSVRSLHHIFYRQVGDQGIISPQGNTIRLPHSNSRPEPDIAILKWRDDIYKGKQPAAEDVLLLVEVAKSTIKYDKGEKLALYAEAGIPEYWVVNVVQGVIEVYTQPSEGKYGSIKVARPGGTLQLPGGLEGSVAVEDVLGAK